MAKLRRYRVDFSDLYVEADDEFNASRIVDQALVTYLKLLEVCEVTECCDSSY